MSIVSPDRPGSRESRPPQSVKRGHDGQDIFGNDLTMKVSSTTVNIIFGPMGYHVLHRRAGAVHGRNPQQRRAKRQLQTNCEVSQRSPLLHGEGVEPRLERDVGPLEVGAEPAGRDVGAGVVVDGTGVDGDAVPYPLEDVELHHDSVPVSLQVEALVVAGQAFDDFRVVDVLVGASAEVCDLVRIRVDSVDVDAVARDVGRAVDGLGEFEALLGPVSVVHHDEQHLRVADHEPALVHVVLVVERVSQHRPPSSSGLDVRAREI
ncbi:hypothetical protein Mapa_016441 [Marchantia paleacea]|nr:hypothetical protein Mapa_016441 [Marchantia paleacea]